MRWDTRVLRGPPIVGRTRIETRRHRLPMSDPSERNKRNAPAFYDLGFIQCRPAEAVEQFVGETDTQPILPLGMVSRHSLTIFSGWRVITLASGCTSSARSPTAISSCCIVFRSGPATVRGRVSTSFGVTRPVGSSSTGMCSRLFVRRPRTPPRCSECSSQFNGSAAQQRLDPSGAAWRPRCLERSAERPPRVSRVTLAARRPQLFRTARAR
jgi:hypothetical protein